MATHDSVRVEFECPDDGRMAAERRAIRGRAPRRANRPTLPLGFIRADGTPERRIVPSGAAPMAFLGLQLLVPGLLRDAPPAADAEVKLIAMVSQDDALASIRPELGRFKLGTIKLRTFARVLAKIAHAYVVANWGLKSFRPFLPDLILDRSSAISPFHLVGSDPHPPEVETALHRVYRQDSLRGSNHYILEAIRLFAFAHLPRYHVVVGEPHGWIRR